MKISRRAVATAPLRVGRYGALGVAVALGSLLISPVSMAGAAPGSAPAAEPAIPMIEIDVREFVDAARALPPQLIEALARDIGQTGAEYLAQAEAARVAVDVVEALDVSIDVTGSALDGTELIVYVGSAADAAAVEAAGATPIVGLRPATDLGDRGFEPTVDLRGGAAYYYAPGFRCSLGFSGYLVSTGAPRMITAGHCLGTSTAQRKLMTTLTPKNFAGDPSLWPDIGAPVSGSYTAGSGYDHGLIGVTGAGMVQLPEVLTWGFTATGAPLASTPVTLRDAAPAIVGASVCKSGSTTGWTCGVVTDVNLTVLIGDSYYLNGVVADICVQQGDSGGAGVVGTTAIGVTSASTYKADNPDNEANGGCAPDDFGVFAPLYVSGPATANGPSPDFPTASAQTLYGGTWEPMIAVEPPSVTRDGPLFSGSVPFGGPRHTVRITFSTGEVRTAAVQSNGSWSLDTSDTSVLNKTYSVQARWGARSVSTAVTGSIPGPTVTRLFGDNRYATAVEISEFAFPGDTLPVPVAFVAAGGTFADALSAGPAAAALGGPLLLTDSGSLPTVVRDELTRLQPADIVIVGGTGVVSPAVAAALGAYTTGSVTRLGGQNRYETSRIIADFAFGTVDEVWVATGANFPDALSAGAAAAGAGVPIVLIDGASSTIDTATRTLLQSNLQVSSVKIAGGTGVVSAGAMNAIDAIPGISVERLSGLDRFQTSLAVNQDAYSTTADDAFIAYAFNFPDALAGSVVAGLRQGPLYIAAASCVTSGMVTQIAALGVSNVTLFGGPTILTSSVANLVRC